MNIILKFIYGVLKRITIVFIALIPLSLPQFILFGYKYDPIFFIIPDKIFPIISDFCLID